MAPNWSSELPILSHNRRLSANYTKQNDLESQSQAGFFGIIGAEDSSFAPGPSSLPIQPYYHGKLL